MINSKGSVVVCDEGASDAGAGLVVVPDGGDEGEYASGDPDA